MFNSIRLFTVAVMLVTSSVSCSAQDSKEFRDWTNAGGRKSSVKLSVVEQDAETVRLKRQDNGKIISYSIDQLSVDDRAYLKSLNDASKFVSAQQRVSTSSPDWPHFRGPHRDGTLDVDFDPVDDIEVIWQKNVRGSEKSSITIADGRLYTQGRSADNRHQIYCLSASDGSEIWTAETKRTDATPSIEDGRVYQLDNDRWIYCLDAKTGDLIWKSEQLPESKQTRHWGHSGSPLLWDDLVIVNVGYGAAINKENGKVVWKHEGYSGMATPVMFTHNNKPAVAIFVGDKLVARDARTGDLLWSTPWESNSGVNAPDPIFLENDTKVFVCGDYGMGRALYDLTGLQPKRLWYHDPSNGGAHSFASPILHDGSIFAFTREGCGPLDIETGELKYGRHMGQAGVFLGDYLIGMNSNGEVLVAKAGASSWEDTRKFPVASEELWNVPAYMDGKLFLKNDKGDVYCVKISK